MDAGAFAGKGGIEILRFEMFDDGDVMGQGITLEEIAVEQQANVDASVGGLAKGIEKLVDRVMSFAAIVAGGKEQDVDGGFGLVDELSGGGKVVGIDDGVSGCLDELDGGGFYSWDSHGVLIRPVTKARNCFPALARGLAFNPVWLPLRQGRILPLSEVLLDEEVEAGHGVAQLPRPGVPIALGGSVFTLPQDNGIGKFGTLRGLIGGLGIVRGDPLADVSLAFPVGEGQGVGDGAAGSQREQRAADFCHLGFLLVWLEGYGLNSRIIKEINLKKQVFLKIG